MIEKNKEPIVNLRQENDPILEDYLNSKDEALSQSSLSHLFTHYADPICLKIVDFRIRNLWRFDAGEKKKLKEDLSQEVRLKILIHLRNIQENPDSEPIYDFQSYVARITHNLLNDFFRSEYRSFATFQNRQISLPTEEIEVNELNLSKVYRHEELIPDFAVSIEDLEERKYRLKEIWKEVRLLPKNQAISWLLKISDQSGSSTLKWLPAFQIATLREIAETVGLSALEMANLWNLLPLNDQHIARLLGVSQRQIINLRKSANSRLKRRLSKVFSKKL